MRVSRARYAIVVQLSDGDLGLRQRNAILSWARSRAATDSTPTAVLRRTLLVAAGWEELDVPPSDAFSRGTEAARQSRRS